MKSASLSFSSEPTRVPRSSIYTRVEQTWVEGIKRWDISKPADKAFLTGGYDVYSPIRGEFHHHGDDEQ